MSDTAINPTVNHHREPVPRWWLILWAGWGAVIAALVAWFDNNWLAAAAWLAAGIAVGCLGMRVLGPLADPAMSWYQGIWHDETREDRQLKLDFKVMAYLEENPQFAESLNLDDPGAAFALQEQALSKEELDEYKRLQEDELFGLTLGLPLFAGIFHGTLLGGVVGALVPLEPDLSVRAWQGALVGVVAGPIAVALVAAITLAILAPIRKDLSFLTRLSRRAMIAVSPAFVVPLAWFCLRFVVHRSAIRY